MKDRRPTKVLKNGAMRYGIYDEETGELLQYVYMRAEDDPTQIGTPLTKAALLSDDTAQILGLEQEDPTVNEALAALGSGKQDSLEGKEGQFLGFGADGKPEARALPETGVGRSMAGKTVEPAQGTTVTASSGAEIFNDYRERTYRATDEGYETILPGTGNIATGFNSHAEGNQTTATGSGAHAEGSSTRATGQAAHAEGGRFTGDVGCIASAYAAHAEGVSTVASASGAHSEGRGTTASDQGAHAEGYGTVASKARAHAEGYSTTADGANAHSEGAQTQALGLNAHAEGYMGIAEGSAAHVEGGQVSGQAVNKASGYAAHAEGASTLASGDQSHAEGGRTTAPGINAHAEGYGTTASAPHSHAEGSNTRAAHTSTHAEGSYTAALSPFSHAGGQNTVAEYYAQTVIGRFNTIQNPGDYSTLGDYFTIGKGQGESTRSNCFRVRAWEVLGGEYKSSGADYAELFEWADGNPENVDRVGRFVTLEGKSIRLAGPGDGYILGIVSGAPSVVGDVYDDQWQGMYLTDVFGRPVLEDVEVPAVTEEVPVTGPAMTENGEAIENSLTTHMETRVVIPAHTERRQKLNPDYDPNQPYVPRSERPEWDAVGMLGKLVAVDDGTCRADGWAAVGEGGEATASPERTRFRVMERIDARHVRILIL